MLHFYAATPRQSCSNQPDSNDKSYFTQQNLHTTSCNIHIPHPFIPLTKNKARLFNVLDQMLSSSSSIDIHQRRLKQNACPFHLLSTPQAIEQQLNTDHVHNTYTSRNILLNITLIGDQIYKTKLAETLD